MSDHYLKLKKGKYGEFYGCPNFPKCNYSEGIRKAADLNFDGEFCDYDFQS